MTDMGTIDGHRVAINSRGLAHPGEVDVFVDDRYAATVTRWARRRLPWTLNPEGTGERYETSFEAVEAVVANHTALGACDACGRDVFADDDDDNAQGDGLLTCGECVRAGQEAARQAIAEEVSAMHRAAMAA